MMDVRNTLNKSPMYEQLADLLETQIITAYEQGGKLPSEQALAEQYQVSRTIIREAIKLLHERGLIDSRTGSGAYVTKPEANNVSDVVSRIIRMNNIDAQAIYDVRGILEEAAVRRAAQYVTKEQIARMERTLATLRDRSISFDQRRDFDFEFHYQIAQASGNPLLVVLIETMANVFKDVITSGIFLEGGIDDGIMRHQKILNAIAARDPDQAELAMREHLAQSLCNVKAFHQSSNAGE